MAKYLRALFSTNDQQVAAVEAFTNREEQWRLLCAALSDHLQRTTAPGFDAEDVEAPRRNVLVFHGIGGIGKSTLSRKLEQALAAADGTALPAQWAPAAWPRRLLPVRIDLAAAAGTDFERVVLALRLALTQVGRPLPAFDLFLRRYWDSVHPGQPLEEYLRRHAVPGHMADAVALPEQLTSALADAAQALALPGTVGTAVGQVTGTLVKALREHRAQVRALAGCSRLADLLDAEADLDTLSFAPYLLAWELAQLPARHAVLPVVLLDTFEDVGDRTHRDFERLLQRMVWLMPNVFFVVTGRNRLQWADPGLHGQLDWTGPTAWPTLAGGGPGHILIGDFSPTDREDHLTRRLVRDDQPLLDPALRRQIADRSHGLSLYLDLAVMHYLALRRTGPPSRPTSTMTSPP